MNTWSLRLNDALKARNKTAADLSRATGVSSAGVKKWVEGPYCSLNLMTL